MSRDIFVQDIPQSVTSASEIASDWEPAPLPFAREKVIEAVSSLVPSADFSEPSWVRVVLPGVDIELNVGDDSPLESFALHDRSPDRQAADQFVAELLHRLGVRAFDTDSESGMFEL